MEELKVSVIIPVYNAENTLRQCLKSVLNQDYKNYEVIVVDNNSTDQTKDIIQEFSKRDGRVKYFFEPKRGRGAARYRGEVNSQGDIILMTDSDCIVPRNWIKEMVEPIASNKTELVQGIKKPFILNYWTKRLQEVEEKLIIEGIKANKVGLLDTANFAIKKAVLETIGYTNRNIFSGNDTELLVRLRIGGYKIYFKRIEVLHYYPATALDVFKKIFIRGLWYGRIRKTYKSQKEIFQIQSKMSHLRYFMGLILEFLTLHENLSYDFVTGVAWRMGNFCGWRKKAVEL